MNGPRLIRTTRTCTLRHNEVYSHVNKRTHEYQFISRCLAIHIYILRTPINEFCFFFSKLESSSNKPYLYIRAWMNEQQRKINKYKNRTELAALSRTADPADVDDDYFGTVIYSSGFDYFRCCRETHANSGRRDSLKSVLSAEHDRTGSMTLGNGVNLRTITCT